MARLLTRMVAQRFLEFLHHSRFLIGVWLIPDAVELGTNAFTPQCRLAARIC